MLEVIQIAQYCIKVVVLQRSVKSTKQVRVYIHKYIITGHIISNYVIAKMLLLYAYSQYMYALYLTHKGDLDIL